jgi:uncharacterized protein YbgA (DUF1722 family)/uncharacterized protein YbbK (DUF523 family)
MYFAKPRLIVSQCIEFAHCRWNGLMISSDVVKLLKEHVDFIPVCPEVAIGLGVPREPVRVVAQADGLHLVQPATGLDYTAQMRSFVAQFLDEVGEVDGLLLKSRSPSCGIKDVKIYPDRPDASPSSTGAGFFGQAALERLGHLALEDEARLTNFNLRQHFLTRIYTLASFREVRRAGEMDALVRFQARNKLLLMAYSQKEMRALGATVANHARKPVAEVLRAYEAHLYLAFARPPRATACINVLMHALGYFSERLTSGEKAFFLQCVEEYRAGKAPLSVSTSLLRSWIIRFEQDYLAEQAFFQPYPEALVQISDSGRGREVR